MICGSPRKYRCQAPALMTTALAPGVFLGARCPETINLQWLQVVEQVNGLEVESIAAALAALRR
jgi:hypothetical protein